jgi:hypothetical protein
MYVYNFMPLCNSNKYLTILPFVNFCGQFLTCSSLQVRHQDEWALPVPVVVRAWVTLVPNPILKTERYAKNILTCWYKEERFAIY